MLPFEYLKNVPRYAGNFSIRRSPYAKGYSRRSEGLRRGLILGYFFVFPTVNCPRAIVSSSCWISSSLACSFCFSLLSVTSHSLLLSTSTDKKDVHSLHVKILDVSRLLPSFLASCTSSLTDETRFSIILKCLKVDNICIY